MGKLIKLKGPVERRLLNENGKEIDRMTLYDLRLSIPDHLFIAFGTCKSSYTLTIRDLAAPASWAESFEIPLSEINKELLDEFLSNFETLTFKGPIMEWIDTDTDDNKIYRYAFNGLSLRIPEHLFIEVSNDGDNTPRFAISIIDTAPRLDATGVFMYITKTDANVKALDEFLQHR